MFRPIGIHLVGRNVNLGPVDRETLARFYAASGTAQINWRLGVVSAARTVSQQRRLYRGYKKGLPGYNLAANPAWQRPDGSFGSRHMVQKTGYSYALDLRISGALGWDATHSVLHDFGLRFTVPGEDWHCQAMSHFEQGLPVYWPVESRMEQFVDDWRGQIIHSEPDGLGWAAVAEFVAACRKLVLRRGDKGTPTEFLQNRLNAADTEIAGHPGHWATLAADGDFGRRTEAVVKDFQADEGLTVDGVVGPNTWKALLDD